MNLSRISAGGALLLLLASWKWNRAFAVERFNATVGILERVVPDEEYSSEEKEDGDEWPVSARELSYLPESNDYLDEYEIEERTDRSSSGNFGRADRNLLPEYRNLCEIVTRKVRMSDTEYEYQPPHHHQVFCKSYSLVDRTRREPARAGKQRCAHPGFDCVQRSRTLFMVRRRWESDCWEPFTKEIASGCDCMWPVSTLGDISAHY